MFSLSRYLPIPPPSLPTLGRSLRLVWHADAQVATAYNLVTVAQGTLPIAAAWLAKVVLDRLSAALAVQPVDAAAARGAFAAAVLYVSVQLVLRLLNPLAYQLDGNLQTQVNGYLEQRLLAAGGAIPDLDHFERKEYHNEIALLESEISWQPKNLIGWLQDAAVSAIALAGSLALLWRFQPALPLVLLACGIPQVILYERLQRRRWRSMDARSEADRKMAYCASITTDPIAAKELLVYGVGPWFGRLWERLSRQSLAASDRLRRAGLATSVAIVGGNGVVLAVAYAYVAAQVGGRHLSVGDFALYISIVTSLQQRISHLTNGTGYAFGSLRFMARLFAFLYDTKPSIALPPAGAGLPVPARFRHGLELRDVWFAYPGQAQPVLRGVSCLLRAGETVALVGENGAGKTTLVKLLTRLYDPTAGQILLDGRPLAAYDLASLRRRSTAAFQDFARFAISAQHNIGVGDARSADDRERVLAAARWAGADGVLARMPRGLDTPLTRAFEGGVDLSGGEWQKVATARAAMRDAALVILDEPTAALDAQAERELFARFRQLAEGRTILLISHRFSTVRLAARILVLEDGRIVEAGTHQELVARGGRYAELYELQAGRYR